MDITQDLAYLKGSVQRFLQACAVHLNMCLLLVGYIFGWPILIYFVVYSRMLRIPMLMYAAWIFIDRRTAELGTRRSEYVRGLKFWKYHNDFFPVKLIKTAHLPADNNYIIGAFPHGILASGTFGTLGNNYGGFESLYPGLKSWMITLVSHFNTPFLREYVLSMGVLPASAPCMHRLLNRQKGQALVLMVGGAQETFYMEPGNYVANLRHRKGFIKVALKTGTCLVPAITFGEPDIYRQIRFPEGTVLHSLQLLVKKLTGIAPIMFHGSFFFTPYRKPLYTVVGAPIPVDKIEEPTAQHVDILHSKFSNKLNELFENHKAKYIENSGSVRLKII